MSRGVAVWLTGLPASGKSTIARHLARLLEARGVQSEILDGEQVRASLSHGLGYSPEDRDTNVARIAFVAALLVRNGIVAIVSVVSPYRDARRKAREQIDPFVEVHVATPLAACERRDTRGRYAAARRGEIVGFTGIDDPYEPPQFPELKVDCDEEPPELCAARILHLLESRAHVPRIGETPGGSPPESLERELRKLGWS